MSDIHFNHERSPRVQDDRAATSKTDHYTNFVFNEQQRQQLYEFDYAHNIDDQQSDEGVASFLDGQPDDITSEP